LRGLYFGLLSIAIGQLVWSFARIGVSFTGGDFGIQGIRMPSILSSLISAYYFILVVSGICIAILYLIVKSPFGRMLESTRDNPQRSESIGINVKTHQIITMIIASLVAGVSGALLVILERCVSPEVLFWSKSAQSLMMCLAGGMFIFWGPLAGAVLITLLELFIGIYYAEYQSLILGIILVLVVIFLPQGVLGYLKEKFKPFFKDTLRGNINKCYK
jgi:branched-chain amino acid transport system permease protein